MDHHSINTVRSQALFVSTLQPSDNASPGQVRDAIMAAVRRFRGRGCAALMAQEFGDHPESAAARMRWARSEVAATFGAVPTRGRRRCCSPSAVAAIAA
ncbi:hypothetical protein [Krasilnikovia sp. MM14-A1004]|uniref:hypothetical protein n=1 Tax=Krasilnikovia sp. MM14-A1004 TaxID=3373541 RepID=UPI00399CF478